MDSCDVMALFHSIVAIREWKTKQISDLLKWNDESNESVDKQIAIRSEGILKALERKMMSKDAADTALKKIEEEYEGKRKKLDSSQVMNTLLRILVETGAF